MDYSLFDRRGHPVVSVQTGYAEWANDYDATVTAGLDQPLLDSLASVNWREVRRAADLACGTGRTGVWLKHHGVGAIDGMDFTQPMLDLAAAKRAHDQLLLGDVAKTPLAPSAYELCMLVLADEHLAEARACVSGSCAAARGARAFRLDRVSPFFPDARDAHPLSPRRES